MIRIPNPPSADGVVADNAGVVRFVRKAARWMSDVSRVLQQPEEPETLPVLAYADVDGLKRGRGSRMLVVPDHPDGVRILVSLPDGVLWFVPAG